jgi:acetyl esterase/lipase
MNAGTVDPELVEGLAIFPDMVIGHEAMLMMRAAEVPDTSLPAPAPVLVERFLPGPADNPRLRVLIADPSPGGTGRPAVLHIHGGGYIFGTPEMSAAFIQTMAMAIGGPVVSVDYRLAPETLQAGSVADNYAALEWLAGEGAAELGVDPARIAVAGESAGGGHATILAITARDRAGPRIAFQLLTYPMIDDRTGSSRPVPAHIGRHVWQAGSNVFGWESFLGAPVGQEDAPDGIVPARVEDLSGLPPAWIGCGALDLFIAENLEYARRLIEVGVPCEMLVVPAAYHGFDNFAPGSRVGRQFNAARLDALKRGVSA